MLLNNRNQDTTQQT